MQASRDQEMKENLKKSYMYHERMEEIQKTLEEKNIYDFINTPTEDVILGREAWVTSSERKSQPKETFWTLMHGRLVYAFLGLSTLFWCFLISIYLYMIIQMEGSSFWLYWEVISVSLSFIAVSSMIIIIRGIAEKRRVKKKETLTALKKGLINVFILVAVCITAMVILNTLFIAKFNSLFVDSVFYLPFILLPLAAILSALEYVLYKERYRCLRALRAKRLEIFLSFLLAIVLISFVIYIIAETHMADVKCNSAPNSLLINIPGAKELN
ncbi:hypothetical protein NEFER03_0515 [Nematocida sp. LUAm3]|nr:hypothetical protein NEFER03_0515 [Nematocida sp. LUAm3]KAI5175482.1 hypothetical protein NEFER02_1388 [Nematocida sp. LUAm2]KAI5178488.1 hypothetical protein NEFER01_1635 [Nematocida sp. LUAm1]